MPILLLSKKLGVSLNLKKLNSCLDRLLFLFPISLSLDQVSLMVFKFIGSELIKIKMIIINISIRIILNFLKVIFFFTEALLVSRETQARDLFFIYKNQKNDKDS